MPRPPPEGSDATPEEDKSWADNFKQLAPEDGPRDSSHSAVSNTVKMSLLRKNTMDKAKKAIQNQLSDIRRKREVEAPIKSELDAATMEQVGKAKRVLEELKRRQVSGPLKE